VVGMIFMSRNCPHIVIFSVQRAPTDEDVSGTLDQSFPFDHRAPWLFVAAGAGVSLVHRRSCLFDLQEQ